MDLERAAFIQPLKKGEKRVKVCLFSDPFHSRSWSPELLEQFKTRLQRINSNSTDDDLEGWYNMLEHSCGFCYLGSRKEIDYGVMKWRDGPSDIARDRIPEIPYDAGSSYYRKMAFYTGVSAKDNEDHGKVSSETCRIDNSRTMLNSLSKKATTGAKRLSVERLRGKPDLGPFIEVGPLVTYTKEEGWNQVRFTVTKCLEDESLWIVAQPGFFGYSLAAEDSHGRDYVRCYAKPHERAFLLDGFETPISCARLRANEESFEYFAEMQ
ncbi:MAG: hypothetical protein Q9165_004545 [Trypethelium subeluteriae]